MTRVNNIADDIARILSQYTDEVIEDIEKAKEETAKETVSELKKTSPKNTGAYRKGWTKKRNGTSIVIHNKKYQLTHLLEHGHAKVNGGRVEGKPHIKPAEEKAIENYIKRVEKAIKR